MSQLLGVGPPCMLTSMLILAKFDFLDFPIYFLLIGNLLWKLLLNILISVINKNFRCEDHWHSWENGGKNVLQIWLCYIRKTVQFRVLDSLITAEQIVTWIEFWQTLSLGSRFCIQYHNLLSSYQRMCCSFDRVIQEKWCSFMCWNWFLFD